MFNVTISYFSIKAYINKKDKRDYLCMGDIHGEKLTKVLFNYLNLDPAEYKMIRQKKWFLNLSTLRILNIDWMIGIFMIRLIVWSKLVTMAMQLKSSISMMVD